VNDLVVDPDAPATLYVATDVGVTHRTSGALVAAGHRTPERGGERSHAPRPTRVLAAATYGRSMFTYDLGAAASSRRRRRPGRLAPRLSPPSQSHLRQQRCYELPRRPASPWHHDASGRLVRRSWTVSGGAGAHTTRWDGRDSEGRAVARASTLFVSARTAWQDRKIRREPVGGLAAGRSMWSRVPSS
jgi:hypothetical protein